MLDAVQVSEGKIRYTIQEFDLLELIHETTNMFCIQAIDKGIFPIIDVSRNLKKINKIYSDSNRIRQILVNLLSNALKFTKNKQSFFTIAA